MLLLDILYERVQELREFILLPWEDKKKRIRELWQKYGKLYIILFVLCTIVAFINVYLEWSSNDTKSVSVGFYKQLGGTEPPEKNGEKPTESAKNGEKPTEPAKNGEKPTEPAKNTVKPTESAKNGEKPTEPDKNGEKPTESAKNGVKPSANTKEINKKKTTNDSDTTNIDTTNIDTTNIDNNGELSKKKEIRERRLANQAARPQTSLLDTLGSVGNNLSSAMTSGVGKALSVLGTFFSAIIGLVLVCAAPVVIFYMWMKKLILPLFPTR